MSNIRVIAPFRPLPLEGGVHVYLKGFDWIEAVKQLVDSASRACGCPVHVVTDADTDLPVPTLKYVTHHRRLMLWALEACVRYLESEDFDRDTVMLDIDQLIYRDLAPLFPVGADLGVLIRPGDKHMGTDRGNPLLNGWQAWSFAAKDRLAAFYRDVLAHAERMPEHQIVWGADTDALRDLIAPLAVGRHERHGLKVAMIHSDDVLISFSRVRYALYMRDGKFPQVDRPVLDFRGRRKEFMPLVYRLTLGEASR